MCNICHYYSNWEVKEGEYESTRIKFVEENDEEEEDKEDTTQK